MDIPDDLGSINSKGTTEMGSLFLTLLSTFLETLGFIDHIVKIASRENLIYHIKHMYP